MQGGRGQGGRGQGGMFGIGENERDVPAFSDGENFSGEQPGTPPELPQGNEDFGGRFNRGDMQNTEINDSIPTESLLLLGISAGVLILGCVIAFFFKCRK